MAENKMTGSAGEHWVCAVLSRYGWAAALVRDVLERADILAVQTEGEARRTIEVQVKTAGPGERPNWLLGSKAQQAALSRHEWFVLVALRDDPVLAPRTFIVPRDHLAAAAWIHRRDWLTDPGAPPGRRSTSAAQSRISADAFQRYEDQWDLLHAPTSQAPVLLPERFRELALDPRIGLPQDHPWQTGLPEWA